MTSRRLVPLEGYCFTLIENCSHICSTEPVNETFLHDRFTAYLPPTHSSPLRRLAHDATCLPLTHSSSLHHVEREATYLHLTHSSSLHRVERDATYLTLTHSSSLRRLEREVTYLQLTHPLCAIWHVRRHISKHRCNY